MAFMGIFIMWIFFLILGGIAFFGFILLIIGIVLKIKKHNKSSTVFFIISGIMFAIVLSIIIYIFIPKSVKVPTPEGEAVIKPSWMKKYHEYLETHDLERLRNLVEKHHDMIYYYDTNSVMLLDYGLYNCDIDIMRIALDNGAKFDEPLKYNHKSFDSSLDSFFTYLDYNKPREEETLTGEATEKMIEAIEFAAENGAKLKWENFSNEPEYLFDEAAKWVELDEVISETDNKLLQTIADYDPQTKGMYNKWKIKYDINNN